MIFKPTALEWLKMLISTFIPIERFHVVDIQLLLKRKSPKRVKFTSKRVYPQETYKSKHS